MSVDHAHDRLDDQRPGSRVAMVLGVLAALAMILFWIYVFANRDSVAHNDEFDDPQWAASAEAVCVVHQTAISELPSPGSVDSPEERGLLVARGTAELEEMVAELRALGLPADTKGAEIVPQWLDDYDTYLQDRRNWSEILATGDDPPFLISANDEGVRITNLLNTLAEVNDMPSCAPSADV